MHHAWGFFVFVFICRTAAPLRWIEGLTAAFAKVTILLFLDNSKRVNPFLPSPPRP